MPVSIKTADEIEKMRVAGRLAAAVLDMIEPHVLEDVTTAELNLMCHDYIVDVQRMRGSPGEVEALIKQTAMMDGATTQIYIEQEPGASGVNTIYHYVTRVLADYTVRGQRATVTVRPPGALARALPGYGASMQAPRCVTACGPWTATSPA